jgi:hypothetical protein
MSKAKCVNGGIINESWRIIDTVKICRQCPWFEDVSDETEVENDFMCNALDDDKNTSLFRIISKL